MLICVEVEVKLVVVAIAVLVLDGKHVLLLVVFVLPRQGLEAILAL